MPMFSDDLGGFQSGAGRKALSDVSKYTAFYKFLINFFANIFRFYAAFVYTSYQGINSLGVRRRTGLLKLSAESCRVNSEM